MTALPNRTQLTNKRIADLLCPAGKLQAFLWDTELPRLAVRCTPKGKKTFIVSGELHGKTIRLTIGDCSTWQIQSARQEARKLLSMLDRGEDPRSVAKAQAEAHYQERAAIAMKEMTFGEAWQIYLNELSVSVSPKTKKPYSKRYIKDHERLSARGGIKKARGKGETTAGPLASFLDQQFSSITADFVQTWLKEEVKRRPTNTAHAFRLLRAFTSWLSSSEKYHDIWQPNFLNQVGTLKLVPPSETDELDCLQVDHLPKWFPAVQQIANKTQSVYLQVLLLTGARREEIAELRWQDVDPKTLTLLIGDKVDGKRRIPLTPFVKDLIDELPRQSEWVFSSKSASGHIAEPRSGHNKALANAGLPHVTINGLRRSFSTLAEWAEAPAGIIAQIQGHKPSALVEKHYKRRSIDLIRRWHTKIENWILTEGKVSCSSTPEKSPPPAERPRQHAKKRTTIRNREQKK